MIKVPETFAGWISVKHRVCWVVNKYRRDKRTGVVRP